MATHSSVLAWRIPGAGEPGGLPSMGSHRVRHDWSDLAAAAEKEANPQPEWWKKKWGWQKILSEKRRHRGKKWKLNKLVLYISWNHMIEINPWSLQSDSSECWFYEIKKTKCRDMILPRLLSTKWWYIYFSRILWELKNLITLHIVDPQQMLALLPSEHQHKRNNCDLVPVQYRRVG